MKDLTATIINLVTQDPAAPTAGGPPRVAPVHTDNTGGYRHADPRPGARKGVPVVVRIGDDLLAAIDRCSVDAGVSRAEMIRRLLAEAFR